MNNSVLTFNGGMDQDTSAMYLKRGDVILRRNARVSVSEGSDDLVNKPLKGTVLINASFPIGTNKAVGFTEYLERGGFIFANYNSNNNHGLYWFDGTVVKKLLVHPVLNFTSDSIVDMRIFGDLLIWVDDIQDPRIISIPRALNTSATGIVRGVIYEEGQGSIDVLVQFEYDASTRGIIECTVLEYTDNTADHGDIIVNVGYDSGNILFGSIDVQLWAYTVNDTDHGDILVRLDAYKNEGIVRGTIYEQTIV